MNFFANYKYDRMHASTLNRSMTDSDIIDWKLATQKEQEIRQRKGNVDKEHEIRIRRKNPSSQPRGIDRSIQNSMLFFYPKSKVQAYL